MNGDYRKFKYNEEVTYQFPSDLVAKNYSGYLLLISPNNGNWIVLENQLQIEIVREFQKGKNIGMVVQQFGEESLKDISVVVSEIEGKHFYEKMEPQEDEFTLRIYLTNNCNLRCKHCFMYASHELQNELSYNEIIDLMDKSKTARCSKVIFTGGEVALKQNFMGILKHAWELGLYVQVLTNGTLWNETMIREASNYIDEIQISIDGFNEETNAAIRGMGTFDKSIRTIEGFMQEQKVYVSVTVTPLYDFIETYKEQYVEFGRSLVERFGTEKFLVIFGKELIDGRGVKADIERNKVMSKIVDEIHEKIYPNSELTTFVVNHQHNRIFMNCGYGGLTVNSNGDFYFCGRVHEVGCYGNVRKVPFVEVMRKRKSARQISYVDNIVPCKECDIRYICGGGCRVANVPSITKIGLDDKTVMFTRKCEDDYKNNIYRLMVEANEYLYWR